MPIRAPTKPVRQPGHQRQVVDRVVCRQTVEALPGALQSHAGPVHHRRRHGHRARLARRRDRGRQERERLSLLRGKRPQQQRQNRVTFLRVHGVLREVFLARRSLMVVVESSPILKPAIFQGIEKIRVFDSASEGLSDDRLLDGWRRRGVTSVPAQEGSLPSQKTGKTGSRVAFAALIVASLAVFYTHLSGCGGSRADNIQRYCTTVCSCGSSNSSNSVGMSCADSCYASITGTGSSVSASAASFYASIPDSCWSCLADLSCADFSSGSSSVFLTKCPTCPKS